MCATCVAQGVAYVGGAVAGLQVMAARARRRTRTPVRDDAQVVNGADPVSGMSAAAGVASRMAEVGRPATPVDH